MKALKKQLESGSWSYLLMVDNDIVLMVYKTPFFECGIEQYKYHGDEYYKSEGYVECPIEEVINQIKSNVRKINKIIKL